MVDDELNIYLLGQAYDNIQFLMLGYRYNQFSNELVSELKSNNHYIQQLYSYCQRNNYNPVWVLAVCFDRFKYLNRKRKNTPIMLPSQLNLTHIQQAVMSSQHYEEYKKDHDVLHFPYLNSLYLIALKVWFMVPYNQLVTEVKHEIKTAQSDFFTEPYLRPDLEAMRKRVMRVISAKKQVWRYILFFEGAYSFFTPIFLLGEKPSKELLDLDGPEFHHALNGLNSDGEFRSESYDNVEYLRRAVNQIQKVKGLV